MEIDHRKEYQSHREGEEEHLPVSTTPQDPGDLFRQWYREATESARLHGLRDAEGNPVDLEIYEPYAMVLSTVSGGRPHSRVVLMREFTPNGLAFYTNYRSAKGRDLEENPWAAVNFFWPTLDRQVRIEGRVEKTSREQSQQYFSTRPPGSRIGAAVSRQSEVLPDRQNLIAEMGRYTEPPICPQHWGGYILEPNYFEFWLGRRNRLHERLAYRWTDRISGWEKYLLYP